MDGTDQNFKSVLKGYWGKESSNTCCKNSKYMYIWWWMNLVIVSTHPALKKRIAICLKWIEMNEMLCLMRDVRVRTKQER